MGLIAQVVLFVVGALALFSGAMATVLGKSAVHEILAGIYFLIFTVSLMGIGIISVVRQQRAPSVPMALPAAAASPPPDTREPWAARVGTEPLL